MIRRALKTSLLLVPAIAVLFIAAMWYGGATDDDALRARVYAGPFPQRKLAFRAVVGRPGSALGQARAAPSGVALRLLVQEPSGAQRAYEAETDSQGVADFNGELESVGSQHVNLRLIMADGDVQHTLAHGVWERTADSVQWTNAVSLGSPDGVNLTPRRPGLRLRVVEGVLAVPFFGTLSLAAATGEELQPFTLNLSGATFVDPAGDPGSATLAIDVSGEMPQEVRVLPTAHVVEVSIHSPRYADAAHGILPVIPGAMPARSDGESLTVFSPVGREAAYVAFVTDHELVRLDTVALRPVESEHDAPLSGADAAVWRGIVPLSARVRELGKSNQPLWVLTSSEPDMQAMASVGWPLNVLAQGEARKRALTVVVDGFAQARQVQKRERQSVRLDAVKVLAGTLFFELLLLGIYVRASSTRDVRLLPFLGPFAGRALWVGAACVVLGFTALAYMMWLKF